MKKMRLFLLMGLGMILMTSSLSAQGRFGKDSAECVSYLNFYRDYSKQNNLKEAAPLWRKAYTLCPPTASQYIFIDGRKIMEYLIGNFKGSPEVRSKMVDTLLKISETRAQYYPKYANTAKENRVYDMITFLQGNERVIFNEIDKVIEEMGTNAGEGLFVVAMQKAKALYEDKKMSEEDVLQVYSDLSPILEEKLAKDPSDQNKIAQAAFSNAFISSGVASCNNLINIFTPRFESNPDDLKVVKTIVKLLIDNNDTLNTCLTSDLFLKTVTALNKLEPSYNSNYSLYKLNSSKGNNDEALAYLQEAIDSPESNDQQDADLLFEMAQFYYKKLNNIGKAFQCARMAADLNPAIAPKANLLMGTLWAGLKCSGNEIEQRAKYWVAIDYLNKAKSDPELADECNKLINAYRQYFPRVEDAFMYDIIDGKSFTVSCGGMSATTIVRTQK